MNWILILSLFLSESVQGSDAPLPLARFLIEEVRVTGSRQVPAAVVLAAARLKTGLVYSEKELGMALRRVKRLAFVRSAELYFSRGSERGRYVLEIQVAAFPWLFGDFDAEYRETADRSTSVSQVQSLGVRRFFSQSQMVYASLEPALSWFEEERLERDRLVAGYSHFDLLGKGMFLDFQLAWLPRLSERVAGLERVLSPELNPSLKLSIPLGRGDWIRFQHDYRSAALENRNPPPENDAGPHSRADGDQWRHEAFWERNTTDDAWMPVQGFILRLGYGFETSSGKREIFPFSIRERSSAHGHYGLASMEQYWRLRPNQSLFLSTELYPIYRRERTESETRFFSLRSLSGVARVDTGYRIDVLKGVSYRRHRSLFLELHTRFSYSYSRLKEDFSDFEPLSLRTQSKTWNLTASLAYRGKWGTVRFSYRHHLDSDFSSSLP